MNKTAPDNTDEIRLYIEHAREMLAAAEQNAHSSFYSSAVNRAYYAIFYAANAMLATIGEVRGKHSGVIGLFRNRFIKTGQLPVELSDMYGRLLDNRQRGDYDLGLQFDLEQVLADIEDARHFVAEVERWLKEKNWL